MRAIALAALVTLLASCEREPPKPKSVLERLEAGNLSEGDVQRLTNLFPGMTKACIEKVRVGGVNAMPKRSEDCFEMTPPQHWRGLWFDAFEGSQFCVTPATECSFESKPRVWIDVPGRKCCTFGLYEVEFVGRRTKYSGVFGHMGAFDHKIIVDRMISIRPVSKK
jgi:hypothetical protein